MNCQCFINAFYVGNNLCCCHGHSKDAEDNELAIGLGYLTICGICSVQRRLDLINYCILLPTFACHHKCMEMKNQISWNVTVKLLRTRSSRFLPYVPVWLQSCLWMYYTKEQGQFTTEATRQKDRQMLWYHLKQADRSLSILISSRYEGRSKDSQASCC